MAGLISVGQSALRAAYTQLQTTGHNIANVNTVGYSRQEAQLASLGALQTGAGFLGMGVEVQTVRRGYDRFLTAELASATSTQAATAARADQLSRVNRVLADTENGIGASMDSLNMALADVANRPFDPAARQAVVLRAETLTQRVRDTDAALSRAGDDAAQRLNDDVNATNGLLERFAALNSQITLAAGGGQPPNDLLDERDRVLMQINGYVRASAVPQDDGAMNLFAAGGEGLVVGARAAKLVVSPDPADSSRSAVALKNGPATLPMDPKTLGGGSIAGLMQFRNEDLQSARTRLGQLAIGIANSFNELQANGVDAHGEPGMAMFNVGTPRTTASPANTSNARLAVTMVDGTAAAASDYAVRYDESNGYVVTRLSDGLKRQFDTYPTFPALPETLDGMRFEVIGGPAVVGDSFEVHSANTVTTESAAGFRLNLSSASRLATGYAVAPELGAGNGGDVSVTSFRPSNAANANFSRPVTLSFSGDGTFTASGVGSPDPVTGEIEPVTGSYTPGQPISFNGWTMTLNGQPAAGDTIEIKPVANPTSDNRNVKAMISLSDQPLVGGATFNDSYAAILSDVGGRTQSAKTAAQVSNVMLVNANAAQKAVSGVDLDEEAARLMQYQQMYQAAAKVIQSAQSMFDTLMNAVAR